MWTTTHDQVSAALGAGAFEPGTAMYSTGTVECMAASMEHAVFTPSLRAANLCTYDHTAPGRRATLAYSLTGGNLLAWFRDQWCRAEVEEARQTGENVYARILRDLPPGPSSLLVLPYFTPSGTPYFDAETPGAILRLRLETTREQVLRGLLEGVAYEMRLNLELMHESGIPVRTLRAVGARRRAGAGPRRPPGPRFPPDRAGSRAGGNLHAAVPQLPTTPAGARRPAALPAPRLKSHADPSVGPKRELQIPARRWTAYGPSIIHGYTPVTRQQYYVTQTAPRLGVEAINLGLSGSCKCEPAAVDYLASCELWDFIICEIGVNMRAQYEPDVFNRRVRHLVETISSRRPGKAVVLISPFTSAADFRIEDDRDARRIAGFREELTSIAAEFATLSIHLIDRRYTLPSFAGLDCDFVQPSTEGHTLMAENLAARLRTLNLA